MANRIIEAKIGSGGVLGQVNQARGRQKPQPQFRFFQPSFDFNSNPTDRSSAVKQPKSRQSGRARKKDPIREAENLLKKNHFFESAMIYSRLKKQEESVKCAEAAESDGYYVEAAKIYSAIGKRDAAVSLAKKTEGMRLRVTAWEIYRELGMWVEAANLVNEGRTANFHQRGSFSHND